MLNYRAIGLESPRRGRVGILKCNNLRLRLPRRSPAIAGRRLVCLLVFVSQVIIFKNKVERVLRRAESNRVPSAFYLLVIEEACWGQPAPPNIWSNNFLNPSGGRRPRRGLLHFPLIIHLLRNRAAKRPRRRASHHFILLY